MQRPLTPSLIAAVLATAGTPIDANTFLVGHPSSPQWVQQPAEAALRLAQLER
jgi:hypothetical protein